MRCGAFHRVEGTLCLVRHGQGALSGSKTKAPGFAGGYLLFLARISAGEVTHTRTHALAALVARRPPPPPTRVWGGGGSACAATKKKKETAQPQKAALASCGDQRR